MADETTDLKDLKEQFDILKIEMKAMTEMLGSSASGTVGSVKEDALARMELYGNEARMRVDGLQHDAERAVVSPMLVNTMIVGRLRTFARVIERAAETTPVT